MIPMLDTMLPSVKPLPHAGLYAITDTRQANTEQLMRAVQSALCGGVRVMQFRDKTLPAHERCRVAGRLLHMCHAQDVPLIINDDVALAADIGADGVHVGREDSGVAEARQRLGAAAIIGASCYDSLGLAQSAVDQGASYVAFGRFFRSVSKPDARPASLATLRQAKQVLNVPIVAIGGITAENGALLLDAGADVLAVIQAVFGEQETPKLAARRFQPLFPEAG